MEKRNHGNNPIQSTLGMHQGMYLTKEGKDLYDKNFKVLKKEIEDIRRWKDLPCSWISGFIL